jgi:hypothetical protein
MTISGYETRWKVERHLRDLAREKEWCASRADENTVAEIDRQAELFKAELQAMKKAEIEEAARQAAGLKAELEATK